MKTRIQLLFWFSSFVVLILIFGRYYDSYVESFYFVCMLFPVVIGTCYFFNYFLVPNYLLKHRYWKFTIYCIYMIIVSVYLEMVAIFLAFIYMAEYSYNNMAVITTDVFLLAIAQYFIVFLFSFLLLIKQTFQKESTIDELEEEKSKYEKAGFTVRSERKDRNISYEEVLFVESLADYVKIHLEGAQLVITKEKISSLQERLPDQFIRIHRSFLVNKQAITSFSKEEVIIGELPLKISRTYKKEALERF